MATAPRFEDSVSADRPAIETMGAALEGSGSPWSSPPGRFSYKRVFPGEGIMMELIFACGNDPAQARHLPPRDLAMILADSVVLLQTPAVSRAAEVGLS